MPEHFPYHPASAARSKPPLQEHNEPVTTQTPARKKPQKDQVPPSTHTRHNEVRPLARLLSQNHISSLVTRHKQAAKLQRELDLLLATLSLPAVLVTPGNGTATNKKNHAHTPAQHRCAFILNVQSAAEATLLRHQIPQLLLRLRPRLGRGFANLSLRVRNRPSVRHMQQQAAPKMVIPKKARSQLEQTRNNLTNKRLRRSLTGLLGHD